MSRRKITEEAEKQANKRDVESDEQSTNEAGVTRYTQRMPDELVQAIDQFADERGMSRNAVVNLFVRSKLEEKSYL